jgi:hypothetical protein
MSLTKIENICDNCNNQYIIVLKEESIQDLAYCPFCASPIEEIEVGEDE